MRLFEVLNEEEGKTVVFSYGRFNPPTKGHEKLINAGLRLAQSKNADYLVFPSKSYDKRRNPLPLDLKLKYLRAFFPKVKFVTDQATNTPYVVLRWLEEHGYKNVYMVAGDDRVDQFKKGMSEYVKSLNPTVDPNKAYDFDEFDVISAGHRDPDAGGAGGASGTKAREFAINGQESDFVNMIAPNTGTLQLKLSLYKDLRKYLGVEK